MNKIMFSITEGISYKLDELCLYIAGEGKRYNEHKTLYHIVDNLATKISTIGYNKFFLAAK